MAKIYKNFGSASTSCNVTFIDADSNLIMKPFTFEGRKSETAIRTAIRKQLDTNNFFISDIITNESEEVERYEIELEAFMANAYPCEADKSYGREYITTTIKRTTFTVMYERGSETLTFNGVVGESKARRLISQALETQNFLIMGKASADVKMFMTKEHFVALATKTN